MNKIHAYWTREKEACYEKLMAITENSLTHGAEPLLTNSQKCPEPANSRAVCDREKCEHFTF
jgi:hypothetical protein